MSISTSIIITTYNWPAALDLALHSLQTQDCDNFEVLVADDGSTEATQHCIEKWQQRARYPLQHIHQEDDGFRAAKIRNKAAAAASGDYLIFLDGDCISPNYFISRHRRFAEKNYFVPGNRVFLRKNFTDKVLSEKIHLSDLNYFELIKLRLNKQISRFIPLIYLPDFPFRKRAPKRWKSVNTCNLGVWKKDFLATNGFNETFEGWGHEDAEFVIRLIHHGVHCKSGRFALPVFHLWHPHQDRSKEVDNRQVLEEAIVAGNAWTDCGVDQYF